VTTVAVIQPYFFPYAGYFRLFAAADVVVMFDCVQFPRRGWVHRNRFALASGELDWLTLPLAKADRDARIDDLRFAADARPRLDAELRRFPELDQARATQPLVEKMLDLSGDVAGYLCGLVNDVAGELGLARRIVRSSTLAIDPALRAQDRVIAIVKALEGTHYVNPSGGRELYDHASFERAGLTLRFFEPYHASMHSILTRLIHEPPEHVAREIVGEATPVA
jgi:WbqC-like protein family